MKVFAIAQMTFFESVRQPSGLVISILLTVLMFISPSFSTFNMGDGVALVRTNLLSTMMIGGVFYISMIATSLIYKELGSGTIMSVISKPISITKYYLSKCLGIFGAMSLFFTILMTSAILSIIIGTPDTASTKLNYLPIFLMLGCLLLLSLLSAAMNYLTGVHLISFLFLSWGVCCPVLIILVLWLSQPMGYPMPNIHGIIEYFKAAGMLFLLMLVMSSFAVSLSSFTGPVLNLVFCIMFLLLGLMAPGLQQSLSNDIPNWLSKLMQWLPNFHLFWMADLLNLEKEIPLAYMMTSLAYALMLIAGFTSFGVFILLQKDYS